MALVPVVQPESAASAPRTHARLPAVGTGRPPCGQGRPGHLHPRPDHRQGPGQGRRDRRTHRGDDHPGLQGHPGVPSRGHPGQAGCEIPTTDRPSPPLAEMAQAWGVQVTYGPMPAGYLGWYSPREDRIDPWGTGRVRGRDRPRRGLAGRHGGPRRQASHRPASSVRSTSALWTGRRFRHSARFIRWRPDRDPADCTYRQLPPLQSSFS